MKRFTLSLLALALLAVPGRSAVSHGYSFEWLVVTSDLVVVGTIEDMTGSQVTLKVSQLFKGKSSEQKLLFWAPRTWSVGDQLAAGIGHEFVVPLSRTKQETDAADPEGPWLITGAGEIPDLSVPEPSVLAMHKKEIRGRDNILREVRDMAAASAGAAPVSHYIVTSPQSRPQKPYITHHPDGSMSAVGPGYSTTEVPTNRRLERYAREWLRSDDPEDRINGIQALAHFRSEENVALLRAFHDDPDSYLDTRPRQPIPWFPIHRLLSKEVEVNCYPVRKQSLEVLTKWGVDDPRFVLEEPAREFPLWVILLAGLTLVIIAWLGWRFLWKRRPIATMAGGPS